MSTIYNFNPFAIVWTQHASSSLPRFTHFSLDYGLLAMRVHTHLSMQQQWTSSSPGRANILELEVRFKPNCVIDGLIHQEFEQIY